MSQMATAPPGERGDRTLSRLRATVPPMRGGGGGDGAIACSRQGEVEDPHDVHHSRMGAAQATLVLGALDEEQPLL